MAEGKWNRENGKWQRNSNTSITGTFKNYSHSLFTQVILFIKLQRQQF